MGKMIVKVALVLALVMAGAAQARQLGIKIEAKQSGFFLDPTLERVFVGGVTKASPAERAGVKAKDELLQIDGITIPNSKSSVLKKYLSSLKPSDEVVLVVMRAGKRLDIVIPPEPAAGK